MKKRMSLITLTLLLAVVLSGCGNSNGQATHLTSENEQGIATNDFDNYEGVWAEEDIGWLYGGMILDISVENDTLELYLTQTQGAPDSRIAEIYAEVSVDQIKNGSVSVPFENDGWGNCGTCVLIFYDEFIDCGIKDVEFIGSEGYATWGITNGMYSLVKNDEAHALLSYSLDDYHEMFPEENPDNWVDSNPTYDMSKASGILASLGMTEVDFNTKCIPLQTEDAYTNISLFNYDRDLLRAMLDYPANYTDNFYEFLFFSVEQKGTSTDGYPWYGESVPASSDLRCLLFDFRDDTYSPVVSKGDNIAAHAIFKGIHTDDSGNDYLSFWLISCDKVN